MQLRSLFVLLLVICQEGLAFMPPFSNSIVRFGTTASVKIRIAREHRRLQISRPSRAALTCQFRSGGPPMDNEPLDLSEDNVKQALFEAKEVLGTIFGNSAENRGIGITGDVELVDIDGPFVTVRLTGRFWHKRADVLARAANYLVTRIPEIVEVNIEDPSQLDDNLPANTKF